ncbi:MAG TPA: hypothetical protein PKE29_10810 [Phycisphaerales bacterium]|nr:hypothetical protein [Phycisphaerales bacterium]
MIVKPGGVPANPSGLLFKPGTFLIKAGSLETKVGAFLSKPGTLPSKAVGFLFKAGSLVSKAGGFRFKPGGLESLAVILDTERAPTMMAGAEKNPAPAAPTGDRAVAPPGARRSATALAVPPQRQCGPEESAGRAGGFAGDAACGRLPR